MAKYIPESNADWMKWFGTLFVSAILSAVISYYVTEWMKNNKPTT